MRNKAAGLTISEINLIRNISKKSFYEFFKEFWDTVIQEPLVLNFHIEFLCDELQEIAERVFNGEHKEYDLVANVPPGTTKSTIFSVMFPAYTWTRMLNARHLCSTHTQDLGFDLSRKCRDIITSDLYRACFPEVRIRDDQNTKGYFQLHGGGFRLSATVGGKNPMGFHAHFINTDDPIDPEKAKAMSGADIKAANSYCTETLPSRKVDKAVSVMMTVMQRLAQNDPTGYLLEKASKDSPIRHICLPAELDTEVLAKRLVKPWYLRKRYKDGLLDPKRLGEKVLKEYKGKGAYYYSCQFRQNPIPLGGGMFLTDKLKDRIITKFDNRYPQKFRRMIRYWDKAATSDGDGAYTVGVKMGMAVDRELGPEPIFYVLDVIRGRWEAAERERLILRTARADGHDCEIATEQEPGSGGKESASLTVRRLAGFRVRKDRVTGKKEIRADEFSVQVNEGNVFLLEGEWNKAYIDELAFFPFSTYKDQADGSSGAFNLLVKKKKVGAAW